MVKWNIPLYKDIEPTKVFEELKSIGESCTPEQIVEFAKNENTEIHKCFEWNDDVAAQKYRLQQARQIVCNLVVVETPNKEPVKYRVMQHIDTGYKETRLILQNKDEYTQLLQTAKSELTSFRNRYKNLVELENIFKEIDLL